MKPNIIRLVNVMIIFFIASFLTACSSQLVKNSGTESYVLHDGEDNLFSAETSEMLSRHSNNISFIISSGPMQGKNLTAGATYFAASGRICRKVVVSDDNLDDRYIACSIQSTDWEFTRITI